MAGFRIEPEAHSTICGLVCDKDVGADVGAGNCLRQLGDG
jgi:hypothetical protein